MSIARILSYSTGTSSASMVEFVLQRYGTKGVHIVFADTNWEDDDNYRFMWECNERWVNQYGIGIHVLYDGRTPLDVFSERKIMPSSLAAPCTFELKIKPMINFVHTLDDEYKIMYIGMNYRDKQRGRLPSPRKNWWKEGCVVGYPLLWTNSPSDVNVFVKEYMGIEPPRMYNQGYGHANCGGRCIKQGVKDWRRTLIVYHSRYKEVEQWELAQKENTDYAYSSRTILKRSRDGDMEQLSLQALRQETEQADRLQLRLFNMEDDIQSVCGVECGVGSDWS